MKPSFSETDVRDVSLLPGVKSVMSLGSVLAVELQASPSSSGRPPVEFTIPMENVPHNSEYPENIPENDMNHVPRNFPDSGSHSKMQGVNPFFSAMYSAGSTGAIGGDTGEEPLGGGVGYGVGTAVGYGGGSGGGSGESNASRNARYYNSNAASVVVSLLKQNNVYARPLGNVVYLMPTPVTPEADRQRLIRAIKRWA